MSHYRERKEKVCLNCKAALHGRFCHSCGQQNVEPKESVWSLITHFFNDITHFDGSFFSTVKYLIFKPGFLSKEYISGRRAGYLHPIRMYVFTSAIFFIVFFSMFDIEKNRFNGQAIIAEDSSSANLQQAEINALRNAKSPADSLRIKKAYNSLKHMPFTIAVDTSDSKAANKASFTVDKSDYESKAAYDSAQNLLPSKARDGWFDRMITYKKIELVDKAKKDPGNLFSSWAYKSLHMFPKLLFVSLPIFALLLKLLYVRRRQYYYADHAIFSIHLYIFGFVALLVIFSLTKLQDILHWSWLGYIWIAIALYILFYFYKAMRNFYQQSRFKTFVKYCLLNFMSFIVFLLLSIIFFGLSIFQI